MKNDKKTRAKKAFMDDEFPTQKALAEAINVTEKTVGGWIKVGEWEEEKALKKVTRKQMLAQSYAQLKALNTEIGEGFPNREQAIAMNSIIKAIETLGGASKMQTLQVFEDFLDWMMSRYLKDFPRFDILSKAYLDYLKDKNPNF